jgi:hypothetical protein
VSTLSTLLAGRGPGGRALLISLEKVWLKFDVGVCKVWYKFRIVTNWCAFDVIYVWHMFAFGLPPRLLRPFVDSP